MPLKKRPERGGLLKLREELGLYANLRPVILFDTLKNISPLALNKYSGKIDLITVRELSSGIYFGKPKKITDDFGIDTMVYRKEEVEKITEIADIYIPLISQTPLYPNWLLSSHFHLSLPLLFPEPHITNRSNAICQKGSIDTLLHKC